MTTPTPPPDSTEGKVKLFQDYLTDYAKATAEKILNEPTFAEHAWMRSAQDMYDDLARKQAELESEAKESKRIHRQEMISLKTRINELEGRIKDLEKDALRECGQCDELEENCRCKS